MSAEDGWHSHRVAREGFPEVPREEIGRPEGPWALRQGPGARAGCKGHEVSEEQGLHSFRPCKLASGCGVHLGFHREKGNAWRVLSREGTDSDFRCLRLKEAGAPQKTRRRGGCDLDLGWKRLPG